MAISSNNLNLIDSLNDIAKELDSPEQILGKGLDQPFNSANSGARKILYSIQKDHLVPLVHAEPSLVQTGFENRYGDLSSSIIKAEADQEIIAIIPKFSFNPKHHYFVIARYLGTSNYIMHEVKSYEHTTESYGYSYNTNYMDSLSVGDHVAKDDIMRKSTSYDEYGNRQDGVNLLALYLATDRNMEDSNIYSVSGAKKMGTLEYKKVSIIFNDNYIPLNNYGNDQFYKSFPDIGEKIKDGILCSTRVKNRNEEMFTQSYNRLKNPIMSDTSYTVEGTVIDIDIRSNNPDILNNFYNVQLKKYQDEKIRFGSELVTIIDRIKASDPKAKFEYKLRELTTKSRMMLNGSQFINDQKSNKVFTNCVMDVYVLQDKPLKEGDKSSDRYGGKGVVSFVVPDYLMPRTKWGEVVDVIINQSTCVNRENPGQLFETSLTYIGSQIMHYIETNVLTPRESINLVTEFISLVVPEEGIEFARYIDTIGDEEIEFMLDSILRKNMIILSLKPISDTFTLDKLALIYDAFPWIQQNKLIVPMIDSNGGIRYIETRRPVVCGRKYMYRLKQYSEDKFSSTSLSATNIKNQNTRSKASKNYKSIHSNTPIAMGSMEIDDLSHLGMEYVITNLMIHSVSPQARRLCEQMLTGDPFAVNIQLDENSTNRSVEIFNTYMKSKGLELRFRKTKKECKSLVTFDLVAFDLNKVPQDLIMFIDEKEKFNFDKYYESLYKVEELKKENLVVTNLVDFYND